MKYLGYWQVKLIEKNNMKRTLYFIQKEFYHIFRDKRTVLILIAMPIVQILLFGFAISTEVNNISFMVYTPEKSENINRIINKMDASSYFSFKGEANTLNEAEHQLATSKIDAIVHFDRDNNVQIIVDSSDPNKATIESTYIKNVISQYYGTQIPVEVIPRFLYNPQMRSSYNFVPGIMGLILMMICAMMTSISIVREKELGTMEVLLVSPANPLMIILSKMVPYFVLSCLNLTTILLLSFFVLDIPVTGSLFWLCVLSGEYIILALCIGLFISTIMKNQTSAMLCSAIVLIFPTILLSGMMYPIENMPQILQCVSSIIPARWYISGVRKLMIQGIGVEYVIKEMLIIFLLILTIGFLSYKKFKIRLE